ncbi:MAG: hypothetical protein MHMPM18_002628 [Marteilia pararefringens]
MRLRNRQDESLLLLSRSSEEQQGQEEKKHGGRLNQCGSEACSNNNMSSSESRFPLVSLSSSLADFVGNLASGWSMGLVVQSSTENSGSISTSDSAGLTTFLILSSDSNMSKEQQIHHQFASLYLKFLDPLSQKRDLTDFTKTLSLEAFRFAIARKVRRPPVVEKPLKRGVPHIFIGDIHGQAHIVTGISEFCKKHGTRDVFHEALVNLDKAPPMQSHGLCARSGIPGPPEENMAVVVLLGDMVDRSICSPEVFALLTYVESIFPNNLYLTKGNHEGPYVGLNEKYGFGWVNRISSSLYREINEAFNYLPCIFSIKVPGKNFKIACVHGGVTKGFGNVVRQFANRKCQISSDFQDQILWSDPYADSSTFQSNYSTYKPNKLRGMGSFFARQQIEQEGYNMLIRGHTYQEKGYLISRKGRCLTIFSSINYSSISGNDGALYVLEYGHDSQMFEYLGKCTFDNGKLVQVYDALPYYLSTRRFPQ